MFNAKDYGYQNVIRSSSTSVPKMPMLSEALANYSRTYLPIDTKRSALDRIFDALSIGTFLSAGVVRGLLPNNNISVGEGISDAFKAANPFGDGYEKGEHTYSKVLGDIGWNPESTAGKVAKGAVGLVGDIFLDPLTYASFGVSGLIKGTGKAGMAATHAAGLIEEAAKHGDDIAKVVSKGMSTDLAKKIITEHGAARGIKLGADELAESAEKLSKQYNKLAGVRGVAKDATMSFGNAPFGKKIFGDLADKSTTIAKGETLQKIGDATFAPGYAKLRNSVYGSKFGKLFSTKSKLYELSKTDPTAVYEYLKAVEGKRLLGKNVRDASKGIREVGEQFGLTPDESKQVIELMEDNASWNPVSKAVSVDDSERIGEYVKGIKNKRDSDAMLLEELTSQKDMLDKLAFAKDGEIEDLKAVKDSLDVEYLAKLQKLDAKSVAKKEQLLDLVHSYDESIDNIQTTDLDELDNIVASYDKELDALDVSDEALLGKKQKLADMYNSKRKGIKSEAKVIQDKETADVSNTVSEYLSESKSRYEARKAGVKVETPETIDKVSAVRAMSKYIFDNEGAISPAIWDAKLEDLQKLINKGATKDDLLEYVTSHGDDFLTSSKQTMYSYIAKKMGYDNWKTYYHDRVNELVKTLNNTGEWSEEEYKLYFELRKAEKVRNSVIKEFDNYISKYGLDEGVSKYITEAANKEMMDDVLFDSGMMNTTSKCNFKNTLDVQKGSWADNDFADGRKIVHEPKEADIVVKRTAQTDEFSDKTLSGKAVLFEGSNEKAKIVQDLTEKLFFSKPGFIPDKLNKSNFRWIDKVTNEIPKLLENTFHTEYSNLTPKQVELLYDMAVQGATKNMDDMFKYDKVGQAVAEESRKRINTFRGEAVKSRTAKGTTVEFMSGGKAQRGVIKDFKDVQSGRVYKIVGEDGKTFDSVRMNQLTGFEANAKRLSTEEIIASSDSSKDFFERQHKMYMKVKNTFESNAARRDELLKAKDGAIAKLDEVDGAIQKQVDELIYAKEKAQGKYDRFVSKPLEKTQAFKTLRNNYQSAMDNLAENIKQLEVDRQSLTARLASDDFKSIETLSDSVKKYEDLLNNQDAIESYVKTMSDLERPVEQSAASMILESRPDVSQKVIDVVEKLRADFNKIGAEEVGIGELSPKQFEAMMDHYFPHILTDAGKKLFNIDEKAAPYDKSFGGDFGKEFNEFGETRTMRIPDGNGGYITNPTVAEVNKYYKENFDHILKGENVLSENISDVYVARMLKHSELMYNTEYINEAVKGFGRAYDGTIPKGFKAIMDFTTFREHSKSYAKLATSQEISDMISQHLSENINFITLQHEARLKAYYIASAQGMSKSEFDLLSKKFFSKSILKEIESFIKTEITPEVREAIYKQKLSNFYDVTNTKGYVDKLSFPLLEFDNAQIDKVKTYTDSIINAQYSGVAGNVSKFLSQSDAKFNKSFVDFISSRLDSPEHIRESLGVLLKRVDEVDAERVQRWIVKLDKIESLKFGEFSNVQDTIVAKFNQSRKNQLIKDQSNMLNLYDRFTHLIKLNQTTVLPSFHMRNKMANTFNNWLAVGNDAVNVEFQKSAFRAVRADGKIDDVLEFVKKDGSTGSITWGELYAKAKDFGVVDEGFYAKDLDSADATNSLLFKKLPAQLNPTNTKNFIPYAKGAKFGNMIENQDRLIHFASQVKNGMSFDEAAESVNKFLFDYSDLTAFEQNVMKRVLPYYTWMRKNGALQLEMLLENPKAYKYIGQIEHGVEGMVSDEDKINDAFINDFAKDWVQTPFSVTNPEGREEPVLWNPNLPFMDLSKIPDVTRPIESAKELFTQSNPLLKVPIEQAINRNVFFDSPITKDDDTTSAALAKRAEHVLSQLSLYNTGKDFATKRGVDLGLQGLNTMTGVKMLSYDYDKYKAMKIQEILKRIEEENK